jgi:site-specific recombinase XerD
MDVLESSLLLMLDKGCYPALMERTKIVTIAEREEPGQALQLANQNVVRKPDPPRVIQDGGGNARFACEEFFAGIEGHIERAYRRAIHCFLDWCKERGLSLQGVGPGDVSGYLKGMTRPDGLPASKPTKKLCLAALRHFFDRLVERHAIILNPAAAVRGSKLSVQEGKTPAFSVEQARTLIRSVKTTTLVGLRDRAVIATLAYTAARVGAVSKLKLPDYYQDGYQKCLRLDEKGGKVREIPVRSDLEGFLNDYLEALGAASEFPDMPLFRTTVRWMKGLTPRGMTGDDILRMVKRRLRGAGLPQNRLTCLSFRATTITDLLTQGVPLEDVQYLAGHADPRTTRLYDRGQRTITRNIVERITI